jgi:hypothetical protein
MNKTKIEWCDYELGWLSGIIDGEGNLGLFKETRKNFKAGVTYKPRLNISNTDINIINKCRDIIGYGSIIPHNHKKRISIGQKPCWILDVSSNGLRDLFPKIRLIAKEKQKQLLLKAMVILSNHKGKKNPRTDAEIKRLEIIYLEIRRLNKRGI